MVMPEASVDKNCNTKIAKNEIRSSGQVARMGAIAQVHAAKQGLYNAFRCRTALPNARHEPTPLAGRECVDHAATLEHSSRGYSAVVSSGATAHDASLEHRSPLSRAPALLLVGYRFRRRPRGGMRMRIVSTTVSQG